MIKFLPDQAQYSQYDQARNRNRNKNQKIRMAEKLPLLTGSSENHNESRIQSFRLLFRSHLAL